MAKDASSISPCGDVDLEARVIRDQSLRAIRDLTNVALSVVSAEFETPWSRTGRSRMAPEKLLRALLRQPFCLIRLELRLLEQQGFNLLLRWFAGLGIDARVCDPIVFTENRERPLAGVVGSLFLMHPVSLTAVQRLPTQGRCSAGGTQVEAWTSTWSFREFDEVPAGEDDDDGCGRHAACDLHGARWLNATHRSTMDDDRRLCRTGKLKEAKVSDMGQALTEKRSRLEVDSLARRATGRVVCLGDEVMVIRREEPHRTARVGADKTRVTRRSSTGSARPSTPRRMWGARSRFDAPVSASEVRGTWTEETFGRVRTAARSSQIRHRGLPRIDRQTTLARAACDLSCLPKLSRAADDCMALRHAGAGGFLRASPCAGPHRCVEVCRLRPCEHIEPTWTVMSEAVHENPGPPGSSAPF